MKEFGTRLSGDALVQLLDNYISDDFCQDILSYLKQTDEWATGKSFENTELINIYHGVSFDQVNELLALKDRMQKDIEAYNNIKLKNLSFYFIKWNPGSYLDFHSDNSNLDGTDNGFSHLKHAAMIYLNNDFVGGSTLFKDFTVPPTPKSFIAFDGGIKNIHAVEDIKSGHRYMIGTFWDYDNE